MIQVWVYDKNNIFIESTFVDELTDNMTTVPLLIGYIKPLFNGTKWIEGATQSEIDDWVEQNKSEQNSVTEEEKLKNRLNQQEQAIGVLATQLAKNTLLQNGGAR